MYEMDCKAAEGGTECTTASLRAVNFSHWVCETTGMLGAARWYDSLITHSSVDVCYKRSKRSTPRIFHSGILRQSQQCSPSYHPHDLFHVQCSPKGRVQGGLVLCGRRHDYAMVRVSLQLTPSDVCSLASPHMTTQHPQHALLAPSSESFLPFLWWPSSSSISAGLTVICTTWFLLAASRSRSRLK